MKLECAMRFEGKAVFVQSRQARKDLQRPKLLLAATMVTSPGSFLVHVISYAAAAGTRSCSNESAFTTADQTARAAPIAAPIPVRLAALPLPASGLWR